MNTAEMRYIALGVAQFISDTKKAQKAEEEFAAAARRAEDQVGDASKKAAAEVTAAALAKEAAAKKAAFALKALGTVTTGIFTAAFGVSIKKAMDFEDALDQVGAVAQATGEDMGRLREEAVQIGADTSFSANQAAKAMHELAAGGRSVAQILGGEARAAVGLAEAGNYGLAESAKTIATAMDIWKSTQIDTNDVVNRLAGAANTSRFGVEDMSMAIAQGGGVAAQAGVSFQDFSTVIAATASSFASGSDAGTSFKTFITSLSGSSDVAKEKITELGLRFYDAQGAIRPMSEIVQELHDKLGPLSQEQQTVALKTIFGNDAFRTAASLMQLTGTEFSTMSDKMRDTNAIDVAAQRMGNASGGMEQLRGSIESLMIAFGTQFIPMITKVLGVLTKLVNWFGELPSLAKNILAIGAAALAVTPLILGWAASMKTAATTLGILSAASAASGGGGAAKGAKAAKGASSGGALGLLGLAGMGGTIAAAAAVGAAIGEVTIRMLPENWGGNDKGFLGVLGEWKDFLDGGPTQAERLAKGIDAVTKSLQGFNEEKGAEKLAIDLKSAVDQLKKYNEIEAMSFGEQGDARLAAAAALGIEPKKVRGAKPYLDKEGLEDYYEAVEIARERTAALVISQYEAIGGAEASGYALIELGGIYGSLDAETRSLIDDNSTLETSLLNIGHASQVTEIQDYTTEWERYGEIVKGVAEGPQLSLYETMMRTDQAFGTWSAHLFDAETKTTDWGRGITELNARFVAMNPELATANAKIAAYRDELGEMERANLTVGDTFGMTKEAIEEQITSLEESSTAYAGNLAVMEAVGHQVSVLASAKGWAGINFALQESTLNLEEQAEAAIAVSQGLTLISDGSLDGALTFFDNLRISMADQPELWAAIARVVGPEFIEAIAAKVEDPANAQRLTEAANRTFEAGFLNADYSPASVAAAKLMDLFVEGISGPNMEALVLGRLQETLSAIERTDNRAEAAILANNLITWISENLPSGPHTDKLLADAKIWLDGLVNAKPAPETTAAVADNTVDATATAITTPENQETIAAAMGETLNAGIANTVFNREEVNRLGREMIDGVVAGIQSRAGNVGGALTTEMAGAVMMATGPRPGVDTGSPSKVTRDDIGIPMVEGIVEGIKKSGPKAAQALVNVINSMNDDARMAMSGLLDAFAEGWSEGEAYSSGKALADGVLSPLFEQLANLGYYINEDASISGGMSAAGMLLGQTFGEAFGEGVQQGAGEYLAYLEGLAAFERGEPVAAEWLAAYGPNGNKTPPEPLGMRKTGIQTKIDEEMRLANAQLDAMQEKLARVGKLLHDAGGESARVRDVTGEWFTWEDYRAMEAQIEAFRAAMAAIPEETKAAQVAIQQQASETLGTWMETLVANFESGKEMSAEELNAMLTELTAIVDSSVLPESLRSMAEKAIEGWRQAIAEGGSVANADLIAMFLQLQLGLEQSTATIAAGADAAFTALAEVIGQFQFELKNNLATGVEMTNAELSQLFSFIVESINQSGFPEAMREQIEAMLFEMQQALLDGRGIANEAVVALLDDVLAGLAHAAKEAAKSVAPPMQVIGGQIVQGLTAGMTVEGRAAALALQEQAKQSVNLIKTWMEALVENLAAGREMGTDEFDAMMDEMIMIVQGSNLPAEMQQLAIDQINAWIEAFKSGASVANADLLAFLEGLVAMVQAKAAEAAAVAAAAASAVTSGGYVGTAPLDPNAGTAELDAMAAKINSMTAAEQAAFSQTEEGRAAWMALMNAGYGASPGPGGKVTFSSSPVAKPPEPDPNAGRPMKWVSGGPGSIGGEWVVDTEAEAEIAENQRIVDQARRNGQMVVLGENGELIVLPSPSGATGSGSGGGGGFVTGFAHGTNWVPQDMIARLHEGEAVIPAWLNRLIGRGGIRQWIERILGSEHYWGEDRGRGALEDWRSSRSWEKSFNRPMVRPEPVTVSGPPGINFQPGALIVNYSGPADQARQVGEDFGEALMRTLRVSGARV